MSKNYILITDLPVECIMECSSPGPADDIISYWLEDPQVKNILADLSQSAMQYGLKGYGAWDKEELEDEKQNRARVLWLACGTFREYIAECETKGVDPFGPRPGDSFDPSCGSDIFTLE
jgi:hypothetical protein